MNSNPAPHDDDRLPNGADIPQLPSHLFNAQFSGSLDEFRRGRSKRKQREEPAAEPEISTPPGRFLNEARSITFHSRSEAACAALMEQFIPGYKAVEGQTYEIPIGANRFGHMRTIDFRLGDTLIEFHPIRIWRSGRHFGDFASREEWHQFLNEHRRCPRRDRAELKADTMRKLEERYAEKRLQAIHENPELAHTDLIVTTSPADFYAKVILPYAPEPPSLDEFLDLFHEEKGNVIDLRYRGKRPPKNRASSRRKR